MSEIAEETAGQFRKVAKLEGGLRTQGIVKHAGPGMPVVTVVTVVFNDEENIEDIIRNVSSQTYPNLEYIIIDGGSTDKTLDVIRKYEDKIDYWVSETDKGIYDAMNKGARLAAGEWINFMNAGDGFYSTTIVTDVFGDIPNSADLVYGHTYYNDHGKMVLIETYDIQCLWMSMICTHQSIFVKTAILRNHPFNLRYKITSDFDFVYYCYVHNYNFHDTKKIIAIHDTAGVSEQRIIKRMMERWEIVNRYTPSIKVNVFYFKLFFRKIKRVLKIGRPWVLGK